MDKKKELFETMSVPKALATLAFPTIVSQLISMIYNLADTFSLARQRILIKWRHPPLPSFCFL